MNGGVQQRCGALRSNVGCNQLVRRHLEEIDHVPKKGQHDPTASDRNLLHLFYGLASFALRLPANVGREGLAATNILLPGSSDTECVWGHLFDVQRAREILTLPIGAIV